MRTLTPGSSSEVATYVNEQTIGELLSRKAPEKAEIQQILDKGKAIGRPDD